MRVVDVHSHFSATDAVDAPRAGARAITVQVDGARIGGRAAIFGGDATTRLRRA